MTPRRRVQSPGMGDDSSDTRPVVRCEVADGVATITLDSPANRNALSRATGRRAARGARPGRAARRAGDRAHPHRPGVLRRRRPEGAELPARPTPTAGNPMVRAMQRLIDGDAAHDRRRRRPGARRRHRADGVVRPRRGEQPDVTFAFTEVRIGVAPAIISVPILPRCGWSKLAAPFLTGETFDAARSEGHGPRHPRHRRRACGGRAPWSTACSLGARTPSPRRSGCSAARPRTWAEMQTLSEALFRSDEAAEGMAAVRREAPAVVGQRHRKLDDVTMPVLPDRVNTELRRPTARTARRCSAPGRPHTTPQLALVLGGGGPNTSSATAGRGKMLARERIEALLDPGTPFLELSPARRLRHPVPGRARHASPASAWSRASSA